jgi:hypothetical protein
MTTISMTFDASPSRRINVQIFEIFVHVKDAHVERGQLIVT